MKKLEIPLLLQDKGSPDCGPVTVQMVLRYFGINRELSFLTNQLEYSENGTSAYDNGYILLQEGFNVTAVTAQPMLFPFDTIESLNTKEEILSQIEKRLEALPKYEKGIGAMKRFMRSGGDVCVEIPAFKHIISAIDDNSPVIALLYGKALGTNEGGFHFVVVNGYDGSKVLLTNPLPEASGQSWFPIEQFLYAVHTSTTSDIDNGTLLIISR